MDITFFHISEMNFTLTTIFNKKTYEYYLKQSKSMLEWRIFDKLPRYPKLIKAFDENMSHPLICNCSHIV